MKTLRCEWCGQRESNEYPIWGHKESAEASYFISHKTRGCCVMAALARAEAAEALAYERLESALFAEQRADDAELECDNLRDANAVLSDALETTRQTLVALTARVAELEAELASDAADENQWLDAYIESAAKDGATIKRLMARAAELEAALAEQQWRPVTEKPLSTAQNQVVVMHGNRRPMADHMAYYLESGWAGTDVIFWRPIPPLPPAPNVQEPTP